MGEMKQHYWFILTVVIWTVSFAVMGWQANNFYRYVQGVYYKAQICDAIKCLQAAQQSQILLEGMEDEKN